MPDLRRRDFITLVSGVGLLCAAKARRARAQQSAMPVIGFLRSTTPADSLHLVAAFRQGLKATGFVDGQNVVIEFRWADNQVNRLPGLVADLLQRPTAVIVANTAGAFAAKAATTTVPVVFATGSDPVRDGLVSSLNRPGANFTGVIFITSELGTKRLELLRQLAPKVATVAMLVMPSGVETEVERVDVAKAAQTLGLQLFVADARSRPEVEAALQRSLSAEQTHCSLAPGHRPIRIARPLSRSPHAIPFRRSIPYANMSRSVG